MGNTLTIATVSAAEIVTSSVHDEKAKKHAKYEGSPPPECPMHKQQTPPSECPVSNADSSEINPLNMVGICNGHSNFIS